jgi:COMPASS component SWD1
MFAVPAYPAPALDRPIVEHDLEPTHRFSDPINRNAWHAMSFSPDGEWLAGGASDNATHKIYIWDISNAGQLASALDGGREPLIHTHVRDGLLTRSGVILTKDTQWHPIKPSIVSTTNLGNLLIWHCPTPERWGAFAGGFEEVDENVEYQEREDEFDIVRGRMVLLRLSTDFLAGG